MKVRDRRHRGPALPDQLRRRPARHRARLHPGRRPAALGPGRLDDHPAVRQERAAGPGPAHGLPEAARGRAGLPPHAQVVQAEDPHRVPQLDLLRQRRLRHRVGRARRTSARTSTTWAAGRCSDRARRSSSPQEAALLAGVVASPSAYDPVAHPRRRPRAAQPGPAQDARPGLPHARRSTSGPSPESLPAPTRSGRRTVETQGAVLHDLGAPAARRALRRAARLRGRPAGPHDARPRAAEAGRAGGQQLAGQPGRPDGVARRDRQRHRRGAGDGRAGRGTTATRRSTSPPRASASRARRSSRSSSPQALREGISPQTVFPSRKRFFCVQRSGTAAASSSWSTTSRAPTPASARSRRGLTVSDNSRLRRGGHPRRHGEGRRARPADGHPHAGLLEPGDDARRPARGRHAARHGPRLRDVRRRRQARHRHARHRPTTGRSASARCSARTASRSRAARNHTIRTQVLARRSPRRRRRS